MAGFYSVQALVDEFAFQYTGTRRDAAAAAAGKSAVPSSCRPPSWLGVVFPTPNFTRKSFYKSVNLLGLLCS